ncbi:MAG TPA: murein biosynthesis integral membrane protein MurJ [Actinomycetota bacterium]|nr:murein biosynthesis integral membrane protein MurJ [Actinomycetota bacterium]
MSSLARATAVMTAGTVLSRVTGLLRLAAIAAALGVVESGRLADTYNIGNTAPNIIYELVLGGVLTSVFVPVFVELLEKEGRERAWEVASAIINLSLVVLTAITTIGILAAPAIAHFYALRLEGAEAARQVEVLSFLLRLFIPQMIFYGLTALTAGLLNAHKRFGAPMYTPILNNLAVIAVFVAFHQTYGEIDNLAEVTTGQLWIIGLGTTGGVALMAIAQIPFLRGLGRYRPTLRVDHDAVRKLLRLSAFVVGYVITNQLGYLVVQWLANEQTGGYTAYVSAFIFFMLPHGLFAVSVITALLPGMSADATNERWDAFRERLSTGIRTTTFLVLPASVGYLVLGEPVVRILLERGVMTGRSTELIAGVLALFVIGLVPFSIFQLLLRAFYAIQDTKTPFKINALAVAFNVAIDIPLFLWIGVKGLALGHALAYSLGCVLQGRALSRRIGGIDGRRLGASLLRIGAAAAGMGALVWLGWETMSGALGMDDPFEEIAGVGIAVVLGAVSYLGLALLLGVEELRSVRALGARRRG